MKDLESDPDFQAMLKCVAFPDLSLIQALAKKRGVKEVYQFWDLFDYVGIRWRETKSCEGTGELC